MIEKLLYIEVIDKDTDPELANNAYLIVRNQFGGNYDDIEQKYLPYIG